MKKIILAILLVSASLVLHTSVNAQAITSKGKHGGGDAGSTIPASQVPKPVKMSFKSQYPTATNVQWEYKPVYYGTPVYTASFYLGSQKWEANYYADGTFLSAYPKP